MWLKVLNMTRLRTYKMLAAKYILIYQDQSHLKRFEDNLAYAWVILKLVEVQVGHKLRASE